MIRIIMFLVRLKLGVKKNRLFRFANQKTEAVYYINERGVIKLTNRVYERMSQVPINWLLSDECEVVKIGG